MNMKIKSKLNSLVRTVIGSLLLSLLLAGCYSGPPREAREIERDTERRIAERQEAVRLAAERREAVQRGEAKAQPYNPNNRMEYLAKVDEAEAYYKDKCEKVAGIKIYKTVPDVEGLLLLKVRPERSDRQLADPMWPGAAFGEEVTGSGYITSFLGYEHRTEGSQLRGYINTDKTPPDLCTKTKCLNLPGYRWVEVIDPKDGQRYRYSGSVEVVGQKDPTAYNIQLELKKNPNYDMNVYRWTLDKIPSPSTTPPRYAVTFEDHVIPKEREMRVASSTVKVLDMETNEVLGELTRYAISYIHSPVQSMTWLNHYICPYTVSSGTTTRQFADQILIPKREK